MKSHCSALEDAGDFLKRLSVEAAGMSAPDFFELTLITLLDVSFAGSGHSSLTNLYLCITACVNVHSCLRVNKYLDFHLLIPQVQPMLLCSFVPARDLRVNIFQVH
jgi:hypothetical protein